MQNPENISISMIYDNSTKIEDDDNSSNIKYDEINENNSDSKSRSCTPKSNILLRVKSISNRLGLSPISEIASEFDKVTFATPTFKTRNNDQQLENKETDVPCYEDSKVPTPKNEIGLSKNPDEILNEDDCLISNNFTLNSGGRNIDQRRTETRILNVHRRQNVEPFSLSYDDTDVEDEDEIDGENAYNGARSVLRKNDDLSFYGNTTNVQSPQDSPNRLARPLSPLSDCQLLSPECSPKRFKVSSNMVTMIDIRRPLNDDEADGGSSSSNSYSYRNSNSSSSINSCNSNYEGFQFKFVEPRLLQHKLEPSPRKLLSSAFLSGNDHTKMQSYTTTQSLPKQKTMNQQHQQSPYRRQNVQKSSPSSKCFKIFNSLSSTESVESMDDDYMDFFEMESLEDDTQFPSDLKSLISGHIKSVKTNTTPEVKRPLIRRCLSMQENNVINRVRGVLFEPKTPEVLKSVKPQDNNTTPLSQYQAERCFKRPEPPTPTISPSQSKRHKMESSYEKENDFLMMQISQESQSSSSSISSAPAATTTASTSFSTGGTRPLLRKSMSMNDAQIMTALARSTSEPDLIGDFSKPFCLPLMEGRHRDLKSISSDTMAKLIRGEYKESVASFKIIDCRYPYEYDGGHIQGATNLYTHEQILEELVNSKTESPTVQVEGPKRHILVFHCEFSSERGPKLSRFLRNHDRLRNSSKYPALHYPEIYLLHGGYKEFFEKYSELCEPIAYRPMLDPKFGAAYKQFRAKSKSWNGDTTKLMNGVVNRTRKSRSRLVL